jgi:hypothetical protein
MTEVIKSNHPAFRPIDVKMGPDGALYIADWYNPIIQHGEVDFRDPRRDKTHGRIWRVTAKGRPLVPKPKLVGVLKERGGRRCYRCWRSGCSHTICSSTIITGSKRPGCSNPSACSQHFLRTPTGRITKALDFLLAHALSGT